MSPIERAARALSRHERGTDCYDGLDEAQQQTLQESVMVVMQSFQQPDRMMTEAGAQIVRNVHREESGAAFEDDAANIWRAMFGAAVGK